ncbi:hypothetical protein ES703_61922 [subsurface metagenome]
MNEKEGNSKCENCGSSENLFRVTILSSCREHSHIEVYCNEHMADVIRDFPEDLDIIEKI